MRQLPYTKVNVVKVNQNDSKFDSGSGYRVRIQIRAKIKDKINRIRQLPYTKVNVVKVNQNDSKLDCFKAKIKRGIGSGYRVRIQGQDTGSGYRYNCTKMTQK